MITEHSSAAKTDSRFDILKFVMALMIVALHSMLWPDVLLPWLRIGVPVFFILSSYLFFSKLNKLDSKEERRGALLHFIKRSGVLYLFWFVVLFVPNLMIRHWFAGGWLNGIRQLAFGAVFGATFVASWFISANVLGTCFIFYLRRFPVVGFIVSLALYLVCCASSSYYGAFPVFNEWLAKAFPGFTFYFSFPAAMLWIWMGERVSRIETAGRWQYWLGLLLVGAVMLWMEYGIVKDLKWVRDSDTMLSLMIVCPALFMFVRSLPYISYPKSIVLRRASIVFYCVHATVARLIVDHFRSLHQHEWWQGPFTFGVTVICCVIATWLILELRQRRFCGWLKYSY